MSTVYSNPAFSDHTADNRGRAIKAACTTGTESAPTLVTEGIDLRGLSSLSVAVETAGTMTAGGTLQAYVWNPVTAQWNRCPALDLTVQALASQAFPTLRVEAGFGRFTYVPNGVGVACSIYVVGGPFAYRT